MTNDQIIAVAGAILMGVLIRVSNMVIAWLSRVLGVQPPDPIPTADASPIPQTHQLIDDAGPPVIQTKSEAPDPPK